MKNQASFPRLATVRWILCSAILALSGCEDATGPDSTLVAGTWELTGVSSTTGGQTFNIPAAEIAADPASRVFRDDGTGTEDYQGSVHGFTWSTSDGTLTMTAQAGFELIGVGPTAAFSYAVSNTTMTLMFDIEGEGEEAGTTFRITHAWTRR